MSTYLGGLQTTDLEGVISTLQVVYEICQQKKLLCEKISLDCREILKPWPAKKKHDISGSRKEGKQQREASHINHKELPPEEELGVTLVEKALAKAERTRKRFQNKDKDQPSATEKEAQKVSNQCGNNSKPVPSTQKEKCLDEDSSVTRLLKVSGDSRADMSNTITKSRLDSVLQTSRPGSVTLTGHGTAKPRHVPAHLKAPFKTEQHRRTQRQVTRVKSADKTNQRDNRLTDRQKQLTDIKPHNNSIGKRTSIINCDKGHIVNMEKTCDVVKSKENTDESLKYNEQTLGDRGHDTFCLLRQGKELSMPSRFRRLMLENHRLQSKAKSLYSCSTKLASPTTDLFIQRLEHSINMDDSFEAVILKKILSLTGVYRTLNTLLHQIPLDVTACDHLHWKEVLAYIQRVKLVLEGFSSLEYYFKQLSDCSAQQSAGPANCQKNTPFHERCLLEKPQVPISPVYWIPEHLGSVPTSGSNLKYTTEKQLIAYITLLHQVQVLLLERHILREMEQVLKKFHNTTGKESWFVSAYRALYGMICSMGRSFPTVVTDTIDSSSTSSLSDEDDSQVKHKNV